MARVVSVHIVGLRSVCCKTFRINHVPARQAQSADITQLNFGSDTESIRLDQAPFGLQFRSFCIRVFARSMSFRMLVVRATFWGFPAAIMAWYLRLRSGLQRAAPRPAISSERESPPRYWQIAPKCHCSAGARPNCLSTHQRQCYHPSSIIHHPSSSSCPMLVMQRHAAAYPFRPVMKTAVDHTLKRSLATKPMTIPPPPLSGILKVPDRGSSLTPEPRKVIRQAG